MTNLEWILIDIANSAGYDKLSYVERLEKANAIVDSIKSKETSIDQVCDLCKEDPFQLRNALNAYFERDYNHVIGLDAVNQALQLYGVLTGDLSTSSLASVGVNARTDAYQILADKLNHNLNTNIFNRDNCKKALMVSLYGSTMAYMKILEHLKIDGQLELGKLLYPNIELHDDWFEEEFDRALHEVAPKAVEAMRIIQELNNEKIGTYNWTLPDGFKVKYDVKSKVNYNFDRTTRSGIHFTFDTQREIYAPSKYNRGMAPNIIHSIDGYIAREMIRRMDDKFITTIHDEFKCKVVDASFMQQNYLDILSEVLESNLLNNIIRQINPNANIIHKSDTLTKELIQKSSYAIS